MPDHLVRTRVATAPTDWGRKVAAHIQHVGEIAAAQNYDLGRRHGALDVLRRHVETLPADDQNLYQIHHAQLMRATTPADNPNTAGYLPGQNQARVLANFAITGFHTNAAEALAELASASLDDVEAWAHSLKNRVVQTEQEVRAQLDRYEGIEAALLAEQNHRAQLEAQVAELGITTREQAEQIEFLQALVPEPKKAPRKTKTAA